MYPMISSTGFYNATGKSTNIVDHIQKCVKKIATVKDPGPDLQSPVYYCNSMLFDIGFVYYPTANVFKSPTASPYVETSPTLAPTRAPSPKPTKAGTFATGFYGDDDGAQSSTTWTKSPVSKPSVAGSKTDDYYTQTDDKFRGAANDDYVVKDVDYAVDNGKIFTFALVSLH
jgi:hypothetical protein